jgi:hypothetical protein
MKDAVTGREADRPGDAASGDGVRVALRQAA